MLIPEQQVSHGNPVVEESEETLRVAWEGGGDMEKQSLEQTKHNDFSRSWG